MKQNVLNAEQLENIINKDYKSVINNYNDLYKENLLDKYTYKCTLYEIIKKISKKNDAIILISTISQVIKRILNKNHIY